MERKGVQAHDYGGRRESSQETRFKQLCIALGLSYLKGLHGLGKQSGCKHNHCCAEMQPTPQAAICTRGQVGEIYQIDNEDLIVRARKIKGQYFQLPSVCRPMRGKDATRSPCLSCVLTNLSGSRHRKGRLQLGPGGQGLMAGESELKQVSKLTK